jgi:hypothetical protein
MSRDISVSIVIDLRAGRPGFDFRQGAEIFSHRHIYQTCPGAKPESIQVAPVAFSSEVKRPEREADQSPPSMWSYTFNYLIFLHGVVLS